MYSTILARVSSVSEGSTVHSEIDVETLQDKTDSEPTWFRTFPRAFHTVNEPFQFHTLSCTFFFCIDSSAYPPGEDVLEWEEQRRIRHQTNREAQVHQTKQKSIGGRVFVQVERIATSPVLYPRGALDR